MQAKVKPYTRNHCTLLHLDDWLPHHSEVIENHVLSFLRRVKTPPSHFGQKRAPHESNKMYLMGLAMLQRKCLSDRLTVSEIILLKSELGEAASDNSCSFTKPTIWQARPLYAVIGSFFFLIIHTSAPITFCVDNTVDAFKRDCFKVSSVVFICTLGVWPFRTAINNSSFRQQHIIKPSLF